MKFSKIDYSTTSLKEFRVFGCKNPTKDEPQPQVYVSTIFADNEVIARSRFFKILSSQHKIKPSHGLILKTEAVAQDNDFVLKNYGIHFVYRTRTGLRNGYKEARHINKVLAVSDMIQDFGGRHKIRSPEIYIYNIEILKDDDLRKTKVIAYTGDDVKFPVFEKVPNTLKDIVPSSTPIFN